MNRRQKIIVSVTGIFLVLLILIGLTYGYFLTRITGNSNPTSISVTTANLELVYGDGTTSILTSETPIEPGKFSSSKDFTVTNNGNALTDYAVTLEDFSIIYANDTVKDGVSVKAGTVTKMEYPDDMKMEITCIIESDNEERNGTACGKIDSTLPTKNSILLTNSIEVDDVHKYVLTLTYVDSGIDQSADMNKTIEGKIDIIDPKSTIDLEGSVATYQTGDYVEINSTPIKSEIVDGKYKLIGVEPGEHVLYVKYIDSDGNIQTKGSQSLTIKKGDTASVNGNVITFTDVSRIATVNVTESYEITVEETVKSSLRDAIIANAISVKNNTQFVETPPSVVGKQISLTNWENGIEQIIYTYDYLNPESVYMYSTKANIDFEACDLGIWNDEIEDMEYICDDITKVDNDIASCEELIGKYVYVGNNDGVVFIEDCVNNFGKYKKSQKEFKFERVLSITEDDYGISYYYRGNVEDNYVNFAGKCWKIVRIEGDGSIKLILEDGYATCNDTEDIDGDGTTDYKYEGNWSIGKGYFGNTYDYITNSNGEVSKDKKIRLNYLNDSSSDSIKFNFEKWLETSNININLLKKEKWCLGNTIDAYDRTTGELMYYSANDLIYENSVFYYDIGRRLYSSTPTVMLKCNMTNYNVYEAFIGTLTADEIVFAGGKVHSNNSYYYLLNNYQINEEIWWSSLSVANYGNYLGDGDYDCEFGVNSNGNIEDDFYSEGDFRPSIVLKANTTISSGTGIQSDPYVVD